MSIRRIVDASPLLIALLTPVPSPGFTAQPPSPESGPVVTQPRQERGTSENLDRLRARVQERWRVVQTREGLVLVPRRARDGIRGVELTSGQIYIDGVPVSGADLRSRIGADAEAILSLSYLDEDTRSQLFQPASRGSRGSAATAGRTEGDSSSVVVYNRGARVRLGSDLVVAEGDHVGEAVVVLGSVVMNGEASGNVVAVGGDVRLGPRAVVRGTVTAVGGHVAADPTARVLGGTNEVALRWPEGWNVPVGPGPGISLHPDQRWWASAAFAATNIRLALAALLGFAIVLIGSGFYRRVNATLGQVPLESTLVGAGVGIVLGPVLFLVCLALLISIIGIPLLALFPILMLLLAAVWVVGFTAVAERVGRQVVGAGAPSVFAFAIGFVLVTGLLWAVRLAWWSGAIGAGTALSIGLLGAAIEAIAWAAGLGAIVLAWFNRHERASVSVVIPPIRPPTGGAEQV